MGETPTGKKDDDVEFLIKEWPRHGNNYYDFLEMIKTPELRKICKTYSIDSKGDKQKIIKRIKKEKLFEDSNKKLKITGGASIVAIVLFGLALYGAGVDTVDLLNYFTSDDTDLDFECVTGEYGLTYRNCELGFEITRPNIDWNGETDFESWVGTPANSATSGYLGGMLFGQIGKGNITILVYDKEHPRNQNIESLIMGGYFDLKKHYPTWEISEPLISIDTGFIVATGKIDGAMFDWTFRYEYHDDKLYLFHQSVRPDVEDVEEFEAELKQASSSFGYLP